MLDRGGVGVLRSGGVVRAGGVVRSGGVVRKGALLRRGGVDARAGRVVVVVAGAAAGAFLAIFARG